MPKDIEFPEGEPRYVFERDCLVFHARVDDKPVECLVTLELLIARFGAREPSEQGMRQAFLDHRNEIQAIAREHIENGWIDDESRIFLTTQFTRLSVHFDEPLAKEPAVAAAHRMLTEIIGPQAGEIRVEWRMSPESPPNPTIHLRIKDPVIRREISTAFPVKVWSDPSVLHVRLAFAWSALLSARSRDLVMKSG